MDKLPRQAKDFLALTTGAHDPPDAAARERVQARLAAMALLPTPGIAVPRAVEPSLASSANTASSLGAYKGLMVGVLALSLGGGLLALSLPHERETAARTVQTPVIGDSPAVAATVEARGSAREQNIEVAQLPVPEATVEETPVTEDRAGGVPRASSTRAVRVERAPRELGSLAQETALLRRASEQLANRELSAALALLEEHRRDYRHSQLTEERDGLFVLARCLRNPAHAQREVRAYMARAPGSLLAPRLVSACGL